MEILQSIVEKLKGLPHLKSIILFGSYARGDYTKNSDIDLLLVFQSSHPKNFLKEAIQRISDLDKDGKVSLRVTNLDDYDHSFFQNVLREGRVLWGSLVVTSRKLGLQPYRLVSYDLRGLPNAMKVKISRRMYGYSSRKGKIKYAYKGLQDEEGVLAVSSSTVMLPENNLGFLEFLRREQIPFKEKRVWVE